MTRHPPMEKDLGAEDAEHERGLDRLDDRRVGDWTRGHDEPPEYR